MEKKIFILSNDISRKNAIEYIKNLPDGKMIICQDKKRSLDQNAHFHAICYALAESKLTWCDKHRSMQEWKTLLVSAHAIATNEQEEIVYGIEGELVALRESTAAMSKKRAASLIEYALSFYELNRGNDA
jgi:NinB protein